MRLAIIAMPRSGHTAIMRWLMRECRLNEKPVEELGKPFAESIANVPSNLPILVIRSYPNWAASVVAKYKKHDRDKLMSLIEAWITHAKHALTVPTILFDSWCAAGLGDDIAGAPSSFTNGSPLGRYRQVSDDPRWQRMMSFYGALAESERLFGNHVLVPGELA